jgi:hypothetical protein
MSSGGDSEYVTVRSFSKKGRGILDDGMAWRIGVYLVLHVQSGRFCIPYVDRSSVNAWDSS